MVWLSAVIKRLRGYTRGFDNECELADTRLVDTMSFSMFEVQIEEGGYQKEEWKMVDSQ